MNLSDQHLNFSHLAKLSAEELYFRWTALEVVNLIIAVSGAVLNSLILFLFLTKKCLQTPFTVYLMNLLLANFMNTGFAKLTSALIFLSRTVRSSPFACTFYLITNYISSAAITNTHVIITANRVWAVTFPYSYKTRHTKTMAIWVCVILWIYVISMLSPQLVMDGLFYRFPIDLYGRCLLNAHAQGTLVAAMLIFMYLLPEILNFASFPWVFYKRKRVVKRIAGTSMSGSGTSTDKGHRHVVSSKMGTEHRAYTYSVYFMLMISTFVCWTPLLGGTLVGCFVDFKNEAFFKIAVLLFAAEAVVDPLLFTVAFKDLRSAVFKVLRFPTWCTLAMTRWFGNVFVKLVITPCI